MSVAKIVSALQFCPGGRALDAPPQHDPAPSLQSRCFNVLLRLLPFRKQLASAEAVQAHVHKRALQPASHEPTGLGRGVEVTLTRMGGWPVYYTAPSSGHEGCNYVMFLHGGGFINEIVPAHWRLIGQMTREARVVCVVPIYPLAPRATAKDVVPATAELLRMLLEDAGPAKVTVVGNSAGAGLALAVCQWLRDRGHRQPNLMVLISPPRMRRSAVRSRSRSRRAIRCRTFRGSSRRDASMPASSMSAIPSSARSTARSVRCRQ
ncbi:acetyl esterase/lipase [Bradyrhizobium diazoefficiens]